MLVCFLNYLSEREGKKALLTPCVWQKGRRNTLLSRRMACSPDVFICHLYMQVTKPRDTHLDAVMFIVVLKRWRKLGEWWKSMRLQRSWIHWLFSFRLYYIELGEGEVITILWQQSFKIPQVLAICWQAPYLNCHLAMFLALVFS